jgi:phenylacetate-CoA ligase
MHKYQPEYMVGYAMANYLLARFIKENHLSAPSMKAVLTSSEKLTQEMRDVFHEVYGCKIYDAWSGVEACGLVSECEHGSLHISPDVGIIELLDKDGKPVKPGEIGEVVCTGLLNYDQPLIRYRIGDYMRLAEGICACGRHMPVVDEIIGRLEDVVVTKDGREMVRFHSIFTGMPNIIKGQVVQEAIDDIALNIVALNPLTESEKQILKERLYNQLGNVNVYISELKEIPGGANGKFRAVISKIKKS